MNVILTSGQALAAVGSEGYLLVRREGTGSEGRVHFMWRVLDSKGYSLGEGHDLSSGASGVGADPKQMLGTLVSFLSACAESRSYPDGENSDLFPAPVGEWAVQASDELSMLGYELDEDGE